MCRRWPTAAAAAGADAGAGAGAGPQLLLTFLQNSRPCRACASACLETAFARVSGHLHKAVCVQVFVCAHACVLVSCMHTLPEEHLNQLQLDIRMHACMQLHAARTCARMHMHGALARMLAGAPVAGLLATSIVGNTFEDFLMMSLAGGAAYASVLNLPLRCALEAVSGFFLRVGTVLPGATTAAAVAAAVQPGGMVYLRSTGGSNMLIGAARDCKWLARRNLHLRWRSKQRGSHHHSCTKGDSDRASGDQAADVGGIGRAAQRLLPCLKSLFSIC